jgi:hypothetical protein
MNATAHQPRPTTILLPVLGIVVAVLAILLPILAARGMLGADSPRQARAEIDRLSPSQRDELRRRWERFRELPRAEQQQLRHLHEQLSQAPDRAELQQTAESYHKWLSELPPLTRSELLAMPPEQRIEHIERLLDQRAKADLRKFDREKATALRAWLAEQADRMIERLPEARRTRVERIRDPRARRMTMAMLWNAPRAKSELRELLRDDDLDSLRHAMPEPTAQQMASLPPQQQWRLVDGWIRQAVQRRWRTDGGPDDGMLGSDVEQRLMDLVEHELDDEELDRLMSLPPEQMRGELMRLYLKRNGGARSGNTGWTGADGHRGGPRRFGPSLLGPSATPFPRRRGPGPGRSGTPAADDRHGGANAE